MTDETISMDLNDALNKIIEQFQNVTPFSGGLQGFEQFENRMDKYGLIAMRFIRNYPSECFTFGHCGVLGTKQSDFWIKITPDPKNPASFIISHARVNGEIYADNYVAAMNNFGHELVEYLAQLVQIST